MNLVRSVSIFALAGAALSAQANLLVNGGFETGDFSGWTLDGDDALNVVTNRFVSEGAFAAALGEFDRNGTLTQSFATVAGTSYTFTFDLAASGETPSFFSAAFGGTTLYSATNPPFDVDYVPYSFTVTATAPTTDVVFTFRDDVDYFYLDNVSVVANSAPTVPGPLAALPFALMALRRRKR